MDAISIAGATSAATFKLPNFNIAVTSKQPVKESDSAADASVKSNASTAFKPTSAVATETRKATVRGMSHQVESYDAHGKVIIRYEDSGNNVIYQTPSEMAIKTQDLMTNTQSSNIKV